MNLIGNLKIAHKLSIVFAVLVIGFSIIAFAYNSAANAERSATLMDQQANKFGTLVDRIEIGILQARRREKDFLLRSQDAYLTKHADTVAELYISVDQLQELAPSEKERGLIDELRTLVQSYESGFEKMAQAKVALGLNEKSGHLGALRNAVHKAEDVLKKHDQIGLTASMLMMRRHEKDFLARKKDKYVKKIVSEHTEFSRRLERSDLSGIDRQVITKAMEKYHAGFKQVVKDTAKIALAIAAFRDAVHALDPILTSLEEAKRDNLASNRAKLESERSRSKRFFFGALLAVAAFIAIMLFLVARAITGPIRQAGEIADAIASGKLDSTIEADSKDEAGWLLQSLKTMQENLRERIEADRRLASETGRIKQALDNVSANVMVADAEHNIIYLNHTMAAKLREAEADLRKALPHFDTQALVGSSIDSLHTDPGQQRRVLSDLRGTHTEELTLGERTFRSVLNPVVDEDGERLGTVVEWADRTQERAVENEVQSIVESAKAGDLTQRIALDGKEGFFGILSAGINELVDVSERVINDTVRVLGAMAQGNLNETIDQDYQGAFDQLKHDANATVAKLTEIIDQVKTGADEINTGADEISQGNTNLSQRTEEQASSLEQTASSMEEMTGTVKQNADNAAQANQLASGARQQAEQGGEVVSQAVSAMSEINSSSKKIADIIGVIDEIAFQTNLLALNAAVEAARAGEQGRGFAVVATEVRNLAQRSATAAKEIKELIEDSVGKVEDGSKLVDQSGQTLEEIVNSVKKVSDIVAEIAAASQEQSSGIEQVNKAIVQMDEMTQQNAALVEEAAAASESMSEQARNMNSLMAFFQVGDEASAVVTESPRQERRSPNRAWTGAKVETSDPAPKKVVAGGGDDEWEEF